MYFFFKKLHELVAHYQVKYPLRPQRAAGKVAWWCIKSLFHPQHEPNRMNSEVAFGNSWYAILLPRGQLLQQNDRELNVPVGILPAIPDGSKVFINIGKALELVPTTRKIALIFFMGIGDYFFTTQFIQILKNKYSQYTLEAWVSSNFDTNNSPLVGLLLEKNLNIESVHYFNGCRSNSCWMNYDCRDCIAKLDSTTLAFPIIYEYSPVVVSRTKALCDAFCLLRPSITLPPIVYTHYAASNIVDLIKSKIDTAVAKFGLKGIIFLQTTARSTSYIYSDTATLIQKFTNNKYFVLTVEKTDINDECCISIDIDKVNINETIKLLSLLKADFFYCVSVASCYWAISAGLNIPNLGMQHWHDPNIEAVWFPNTFVVAHCDYPELPASRVFVADLRNYSQVIQGGSLRYHYTPDFVFECFTCMVSSF